MAVPARFLKAAFLVAALTLPTTLGASGMPEIRLATRGVGAVTSQSAGIRSWDWFVRVVEHAWSKAVGSLDPKARTTKAPLVPCGDNGANLDPNGCTR